MRFIRQLRNACQLACLMMVLDNFGKSEDRSSLSAALPHHSWGNSLFELGTYLQHRGIRTVLYSNGRTIRDDWAKEYLESGGAMCSDVVDRLRGTIIVGIGKRIRGKIVPHYVVVEKTDDFLTVFDPASVGPVRVSFQEILRLSQEPMQKNGFWLAIL